MTSATLLRKTLLMELQERIIPDVRKNGAQQLGMARLPLTFPPNFSLQELPYPPLREADAKRTYPEGVKWDAVHLQAHNCPTLFCVVEGEADILFGVTTGMLSQTRMRDKPKEPRGGYVVSAGAPSYLLVPPGVPRGTGDIPPWNRPEPHTGSLRIMQIRVLSMGALCHHSTMVDGLHKVQYSLLVKDEHLLSVSSILQDELATRAPDSQITGAQLLTLMLRLERGLASQPPLMTDGLYSRFPEGELPGAQPQRHPVVERAHQFIQQRLHEALSPALIATHTRISSTQLNRIFRAHTGMSTMSYVAKLRMEAAQLLLCTSDLSVQEICRLVGYGRVQHFSTAFQRYSGCSPSKYRQRRAAETTA